MEEHKKSTPQPSGGREGGKKKLNRNGLPAVSALSHCSKTGKTCFSSREKKKKGRRVVLGRLARGEDCLRKEKKGHGKKEGEPSVNDLNGKRGASASGLRRGARSSKGKSTGDERAVK